MPSLKNLGLKLTKNLSKNKKLVLSFLFFIVGAILNLVISQFINLYYPNRQIVSDLIFDLTPEIFFLQYLSDPILIFSLLIFIFYLLKKFTHQFLQTSFISFGIMYYMRAFMIPLTPLGRPFSGSQTYGILKIAQHGMFPSGHTAVAFLLFLLIPNKHKSLKVTMFILFITQIIILILSRGHYSIDIVGGVMIAYIANNLLNTHIRHNT